MTLREMQRLRSGCGRTLRLTLPLCLARGLRSCPPSPPPPPPGSAASIRVLLGVCCLECIHGKNKTCEFGDSQYRQAFAFIVPEIFRNLVTGVTEMPAGPIPVSLQPGALPALPPTFPLGFPNSALAPPVHVPAAPAAAAPLVLLPAPPAPVIIDSASLTLLVGAARSVSTI